MTERKKAVYHARILPKPSHSLEITHHLQRAEILRFWNVFASLESEIKTTCAGSVDSAALRTTSVFSSAPLDIPTVHP
ncbi:hypothetical protein HID58_092880 [Brassica napus]|uniref:Uncharacterized protein n=1 Tax=Brassica napus TaxID=3708 RepID=A0ABQ7XEY9_BRANA|nr:hypothetical protein HID58_095786 [Brassica napus]KAH0853782.1 hypothetical protein HID58_092880 [Brassica napus]